MLKTALTFNIFHAIYLFMGYFQFLKSPSFKTSLSAKTEKMSFSCMRIKNHFLSIVDCKTVRISAYSGKREQSNKRSWTRVKTESETGEPVGRMRLAHFARVRLLRHALLISLLTLRKNPTVLQSMSIGPFGRGKITPVLYKMCPK